MIPEEMNYRLRQNKAWVVKYKTDDIVCVFNILITLD